MSPSMEAQTMILQIGSTETELQILRLPQVCAVTGLKRSMIYQLEAEQRFPNRIKIGVRAVGWIESEVRTWVAMRIAESRASVRHFA
jgi:prophage regulatory protein